MTGGHDWSIGRKADGELDVRAAGVSFAGGSEAGTPFNGHDGYASEIELLQAQLGMSPRDALRTATLASAERSASARLPISCCSIAILRATRARIAHRAPSSKPERSCRRSATQSPRATQ
ncbi:MAG: hypothetical protein NVS1B2_19210 [Vulcanimicrobiaceae bacterium]